MRVGSGGIELFFSATEVVKDMRLGQRATPGLGVERVDFQPSLQIGSSASPPQWTRNWDLSFSA
jgi:hypothetical protein